MIFFDCKRVFVLNERSDFFRQPSVITLILIFFLILALFVKILDFGIRRDEMLYVPPAALLDQFALYRDLFYMHVPYSAWIFRGFYLVLGDLGLLFSARVTVFVAWLLLVGGNWYFVRKLSHSNLLGHLAAVSMICSGPLLSQAGLAATNNFIPLPFIVISYGLFLTSIQDSRLCPFRFFLAGLFLAIATGIKISAIAAVPPIVLAALLLPSTAALKIRLARVFLPLALGALIGLLPLLIVIGLDPEGFVAHVVSFHIGPHVAYWSANAHTEPNLVISLGAKLRLAYSIWFSGTPVLLLTLTVTLVLIYGLQSRDRPTGLPDISVILVVLAGIACLSMMSIVPTPGFIQYYIPPLVLVPFLAAVFFKPLDASYQKIASAPLVATYFMMVLLAVPVLLPSSSTFGSIDRIVARKTKTISEAMKTQLTNAGALSGKIATFMPIYPIEAGIPVYPELATGQFGYRAEDYFETGLAAHYNTVGPKDLEKLFEKDPPVALLLGFEPDLESEMLRYAKSNGYVPGPSGIKDRYGEGVLWVRPQK